MTKEKYPSIFLKSNGGYCCIYPSNIFRNTWDLPKQIWRVFDLKSLKDVIDLR